MEFPADLKYSKEHEWVKVIEGKTALLGITEFAQSEMGDVVFIEVETVGEKLDADEVFGTIEAVKTVSDLFLPLSAKIVEFNKTLSDEPEKVNADPYGEGWIVKIEINDLVDLDKLLDNEAYKKEIGQ